MDFDKVDVLLKTPDNKQIKLQVFKHLSTFIFKQIILKHYFHLNDGQVLLMYVLYKSRKILLDPNKTLSEIYERFS